MDLWDLTDLCTPWCVHVVATLRIAEHIHSGRATSEELASASGSHPDSLHRVMRHLASKEVFDEPEPGRFALNDVSRALLDEHVRIGLDLDSFGGRMAGAWGALLSAVRTGRPAYQDVFGRAFWEDLEANPDISASFDALMGPAGHGIPDPEVLANPADWESITTVVDVGGGTGALLAEVLRARPKVRGTLVDLPRTVARSLEMFRAAGVEDRITIVGQSFFDPLPAGHDLYLLKSILSDWPDREAIAILRRCAEAARPAGRVVVSTGVGPGEAANPALLMMVLLGSRERTFDELRELARTAGLAVGAMARQRSGRRFLAFHPA